jgi:hypothetical protein
VTGPGAPNTLSAAITRGAFSGAGRTHTSRSLVARTCPCAARACAPMTRNSTLFALNADNRSLKSWFSNIRPRQGVTGKLPDSCHPLTGRRAICAFWVFARLAAANDADESDVRACHPANCTSAVRSGRIVYPECRPVWRRAVPRLPPPLVGLHDGIEFGFAKFDSAEASEGVAEGSRSDGLETRLMLSILLTFLHPPKLGPALRFREFGEILPATSGCLQESSVAGRARRLALCGQARW